MEAAVVPIIRHNEHLIITKNYVVLDERIVPRGYYRSPHSAHPADRKKN